MAKSKTAFFCQSCGYESPKWLGKCPSCNTWNTFVEELVTKEEAAQPLHKWKNTENIPQKIETISGAEQPRIILPDMELNRVLGGGMVPGSVVLIGGEPGIGKSTLLLQNAIATHSLKVLYVSGEESETQVKMRAERMPGFQNIDKTSCYILTETGTHNLFKQIDLVCPDWVIIDSIQTLETPAIESSAGSISQVKQCTAELIRYAKQTGVPVFLIGHINKDGLIAGPKVLEHMVDTVLQFEGDRHMSYRIVRTLKNRFGSASELGIYEMTGQGLREISNPSEVLISQTSDQLPGVAIGCMLEGNRPLLIEIQSLVSPAVYGTPQRTCTGFDGKRLNMLLAVLEKRGGFRLGQQDVFLNIAGGIRVEDPAIDLAVCMSVISSFDDINIGHDVCFAAEIGLGGELRAVNRAEQRIAEAQKLGFKHIYISKNQNKTISPTTGSLKVHALGKLDEVISDLYG
ncbi:MAG: DNA repair protein RadA [Cytophagales bacterium]|nr:DNA repair protein RadA [Cytophagales bacterium]